jgi:pimeloyl-ACP methyl ester carboxylesterase
MQTSDTSPLVAPVADDDMTEQAQPGHGIPSQDTNSAAQFPLTPQEAQREGESVMVAGGLMAGMATGAAIGVAVAGPVGVVVGATMGAVAGALGGAAAGAAADPTAPAPAHVTNDEAVHLHIEDTGGTGRPLVLIHGWPLSAQAWAPQVAVLQAAGYRVVTYDRRGFGRSDRPATGYDYDTLADDLHRVITQSKLHDVTLVGFSMGGGEVARYIARHGESRLSGVVFAAAVTPCLMQSADNPEGVLTPDAAQHKRQALEDDRTAFFEQFTRNFFTAHKVLQVSEAQRCDALALCHQSAPHAALACMDAFSATDFRDDLRQVTVPTLVIHGDADGIVPIEASGRRTHRAITHSQWLQVAGAPHGLNVSHARVTTVRLNEARQA